MRLSFLEKVAKMYGNPRAVFANGHVRNGQRVRVILDGEIENLICVKDAVKQGKRYHLHHGGRTW